MKNFLSMLFVVVFMTLYIIRDTEGFSNSRVPMAPSPGCAKENDFCLGFIPKHCCEGLVCTNVFLGQCKPGKPTTTTTTTTTAGPDTTSQPPGTTSQSQTTAPADNSTPPPPPSEV